MLVIENEEKKVNFRGAFMCTGAFSLGGLYYLYESHKQVGTYFKERRYMFFLETNLLFNLGTLSFTHSLCHTSLFDMVTSIVFLLCYHDYEDYEPYTEFDNLFQFTIDIGIF